MWGWVWGPCTRKLGLGNVQSNNFSIDQMICGTVNGGITWYNTTCTVLHNCYIEGGGGGGLIESNYI